MRVSSPQLRHRRPSRAALTAFALAAASAGAPLSAQDDVVMLGRRYGSTPPPEYFQRLQGDPGAFRFSRAWMDRNPLLQLEGSGPDASVRVVGAGVLPLARSYTGPEARLGARTGGVQGTFTMPVVLGLFGGEAGSAAYAREAVQAHFFDGPNGRAGSITDLYDEMSGGLVRLLGEAQPWKRSSLTRLQVTGGSSGLGSAAQVGPFIVTLLQALDDGTLDWGRFDNDGPDGIPNSGDDDGFVDVLAVIHPTPGAECNGDRNRIWSHRWTLTAAAGAPYATRSSSASGGTIRVNDYTIQPLLGCEGSDINDIGVFAHELGHAFGLPDLYCGGNCNAAGIGEWGLMGSGSWGCRGGDPGRPCHMSAWSKAVLGWVTVETLPPGADLGTVVLEPVVTSRRVLRYDLPGTREFYLLENRQPLGFDLDLHAPGLLVWHVDDEVVQTSWVSNSVNTAPTRYGVALVQADGDGSLEIAYGGRGDAGDPFPGSAGRTALHAGTVPASRSHDGILSGLTLTDLVPESGGMVFGLRTRFHAITLSTEGDAGGSSLLQVDGGQLPPGGGTVQGAPYQVLSIRAEPGEEVAPGVRTPFLGWTDGQRSPDRTFEVGDADTSFVATYGGTQVQVAVSLTGERFGVAPGEVVSQPVSPGLWFPAGTAVTLQAVPTPGFAFEAWTGALAGAPNPVGLVVEEPVTAGAAFAFTFAPVDPPGLSVAAGDPLHLTLVASSGTPPVRWELVGGSLPAGLQFQSSGVIAGTVLETGSWTLTVRARDALGLEGTAALRLEVGEPDLPLSVLAGDLLRSGTGATEGQAVYLDRTGNHNGRLDVGDVRAYLRRSAGAARVPTAPGEVRRELTVLTVRSGGAP